MYNLITLIRTVSKHGCVHWNRWAGGGHEFWSYRRVSSVGRLPSQTWGRARTAAQRGCPMTEKMLIASALGWAAGPPLPGPKCKWSVFISFLSFLLSLALGFANTHFSLSLFLQIADGKVWVNLSPFWTNGSEVGRESGQNPRRDLGHGLTNQGFSKLSLDRKGATKVILFFSLLLCSGGKGF